MTAPLSEFGMIATYFAPIAAPGGLGLLDDAAVLTPSPGCDLVVTVDAIVAGVHFLPDDAPGTVASKALGVNISDLAAKGAEPKGFLLTLGIDQSLTADWIKVFAEQLGLCARKWRCPLLGGDTVRANGAPFISITAFGEVPHGRMVRRHGARPGDILCVSGTIGDAALGLTLAAGKERAWMEALDESERKELMGRYHHPLPRLELAPMLQLYAHAAMDISDGLVGDLEKLLYASGMSAEVDLHKVPLSAPARTALARDFSCLETIATGGDDYEILCAIAPEDYAEAQQAAFVAQCPIASIGKIVPAEKSPNYRWHGRAMHFTHGSFSHF